MNGKSLVVALGCAAHLACATAPARVASPEQPPPATPPRAAPAAPAAAEVVAQAERTNALYGRARAEAVLVEALERDPRDVPVLVARARYRLAAGDPAGALGFADAALAVREDASARVVRGRALARQRRFDEAAADLEKAVAAADHDGHAWALLSALHANRGDRAGETRAFSGAARALGKERAVDAVWTELRSFPPDPVQPEESQDRCTRAWAALLHGQPTEAAREAGAGLRYAPEFEWCNVVRAEGLWWGGDRDAGEKLLRWAIAKYGAEHPALRADAEGILAEILTLRGGAAREAATLARGALAVRGERVALLVALARACKEAGDAACAGDALARLGRQPHVPPGLVEELGKPR